MKLPVVCIPFLPAAGMAVFPFIFVKINRYKKDEVLIRHEMIHIVQQLELLFFFFFFLYILNYLINLLRYKNHERAYLNIAFEREAYAMEKYPDYIKKRSFYSWVRYL